ncbi:hypothetical protein JCM10449v2_005214 [Rhodotorula kratochvilovae]
MAPPGTGVNAPYKRPIGRTTDAHNLQSPQFYKPIPSSPGVPISVPAPYGSGPDDRYNPAQPGFSTVSSSSFHGAASQSGPSVRRDAHGGPASGFAHRGGEGFYGAPAQNSQNATLAMLSDFGYNYEAPAGPSAMRYDGGGGGNGQFGLHENKQAALAQQRRKAPIVTRDSPDKRERELAAKRKNDQEREEQDFEAQERNHKLSKQLDRNRAEALKKARQASGSAASSLSSGSTRAPPKSGLDDLFKQQKASASAPDKGKKKKDRSESPSKKKGKKKDAERDKDRRARDKGKGKQAAFESEIEDSDDEPSRKSSGITSTTTRLGNMRGNFADSPPPSSLPASQPALRRSPRKSKPAREKSPSALEAIPTLEEMMEQEAGDSDGRTPSPRKRKGRAGGRAEPMDIDEEERMERLRELDSPDELLEEYEDRPDSGTLCPFCDQPFPDHPSRELLALKASLLRHPHARRPTLKNKFAVRFPEGEHVVRTGAFCKMHFNERTVVPEGRDRGYPQRIAWDELPKRIDRQLGKHLTGVILGTTPTPFLAKARAAWDAGEWKSVLSDYGPRGFELIKSTLTALYIDAAPLITPLRTAPLSTDFYLRRVLVPECAVELIRLDLSSRDGEPCARARAEKTREESRAYGRAVFPAEADVEEQREAAAEREAEERRRAGGGEEKGAHGRGKKRAGTLPSSDEDRDDDDDPAASSELEAVSPAKPKPKPAAFRLPKAVRAPANGASTGAGGGAGRVPKALAAATTSSGSTSSRAGVPAANGATKKPRPATEITLPSSSSESSDDAEIVVRSSSPPPPPKKKKKRRSSPAARVQAGTLDALFAAQNGGASSSEEEEEEVEVVERQPTAEERLRAKLAEDDGALEEVGDTGFAARNRAKKARAEREKKERRKRERAKKRVKRRASASSSSSGED